MSAVDPGWIGIAGFAFAAVVPVLMALGLRPLFRLLDREREEAFDAAARQLGLERHVRLPDGRRLVMAGVRDGFAVRVERLPVFGVPRITVDGTARPGGGVSGAFHLGPGFFSFRYEERVPITGADEVFVGEPAFDARYHLGGDPAVVLALMGQEARTLLQRVPPDRETLAVEEGRLTLSWQTGAQLAGELVERVTRAVSLAKLFVLDEVGVPATLARNAREDPVPLVRARNLALLAEWFAAHPGTRALLREALGDEEAVVRLEAASALGEEGYEALVGLLAEGVDAEIRARALAFLAGRFGGERTLPLVKAAVAGPGGPLRLAAVRALATVGDGNCEEAVLRILADPSGPWECLAAVGALGAFGTAGAIGPLRALLDRPELWLTAAPAGTDPVGRAIASIKGRLEGAEPGRLSFAAGEDAAGFLSLAPPGGAGGVALAAEADRGPAPRRPGEGVGPER